jgi:hypothetical protein
MASALEMLLMQGPKDEEMQRAMSSRLRRRQEIGELAQLSGDSVLTPMGKNLVDNVTATTRMEMARADKQAQRQLTSDYYEQIGEQQGLNHALAVRRQDEIERQNKWLQENGSIAERRFAYQQSRDDERMRRDLGRDLQKAGVPEMNRLTKEINSLVGPYFPGGEKAGQDIPGMGGTGQMPRIFLSGEGKDIRRARAELENRLLRIRSGAAVTTPEAQRLAQELGLAMEGMVTDEDFIRAWPSIAEGLQAISASVTSSYDSRIVGSYYEAYNRDMEQGIARGVLPTQEGWIEADMTDNPNAAPLPSGTW